MRANTHITQRLGLGVVLVLGLVASPLWAQDGPERAAAGQRRNDCRLAGQIVKGGQPHTRKEWAQTFIEVCPAEGPPIFAARWTTVPADTGAVGTLLHQSARLRDARIYAQLLSTVQDRTRPSVVRVGAMLVLARYVDPYHAPWFNEVAPPQGPIRHIRIPMGTALHPGVVLGESPLPESLRAEVLGTLETIAEAQQTEPPAVWYAAASLAKRIRM